MIGDGFQKAVHAATVGHNAFAFAVGKRRWSYYLPRFWKEVRCKT